MNEIQRILKEKGTIVIHVPNFNSIRMKFMRIEDVPRHINFFTPGSLKKILSEYGFSNFDISYKNNISDGGITEAIVFIYKYFVKKKI